jgi:hypothetical protein
VRSFNWSHVTADAAPAGLRDLCLIETFRDAKHWSDVRRVAGDAQSIGTICGEALALCGGVCAVLCSKGAEHLARFTLVACGAVNAVDSLLISRVRVWDELIEAMQR